MPCISAIADQTTKVNCKLQSDMRSNGKSKCEIPVMRALEQVVEAVSGMGIASSLLVLLSTIVKRCVYP